MNWRRLDLNLLVVFDAVMEERCVVRACPKVALSHVMLGAGPSSRARRDACGMTGKN